MSSEWTVEPTVIEVGFESIGYGKWNKSGRRIVWMPGGVTFYQRSAAAMVDRKVPGRERSTKARSTALSMRRQGYTYATIAAHINRSVGLARCYVVDAYQRAGKPPGCELFPRYTRSHDWVSRCHLHLSSCLYCKAEESWRQGLNEWLKTS